jgi:hypothetical protein
MHLKMARNCKDINEYNSCIGNPYKPLMVAQLRPQKG